MGGSYAEIIARHAAANGVPVGLAHAVVMVESNYRANARGSAGEVGHMTIQMGGPRCGCGNRGCVEVYASGPAIAAMGMKAVAQGLTTKIGELCEYDLNRITPELIGKAAQLGDPIACEIYQQAGFYLGIVASSICAAVAPRRILIAGGVSAAGRLLLDPMEQTLRDRVRMMPVEQVELLMASLGGNAGVIGAAGWAAERLGQA